MPFSSGKFFFFNPPAAAPAAASEFIIEVDTTKAGSANTHFILPLNTSKTYNFNIDWGDTNTENITTNTSKDHTYSTSGTYTIKIKENVVGGFPSIYFNNGGDKAKLMKIKQWGTNKWITMQNAFFGCSNLAFTAIDNLTANTGSVTNWGQSFCLCAGIIGDFPWLDFSGGTDVQVAWQDCTGITGFPAVNMAKVTTFMQAWVRCNKMVNFGVTNMSAGQNFGYAWYRCTAMKDFPAINMASCTRFDYTWEGCTAITGFGLCNFGGTNVVFDNTWRNCSAMKSFPLISLGNGTGAAVTQAWRLCSGLLDFPLIDFTKVRTGTGGLGFTWTNCSSMTGFPLIDTSYIDRFDSSWTTCTALKKFPTIKLNAMNFMSNTWNGVTMDTTAYDALLNDVASYVTVNSINFHAGGSRYTASASAARLHLTLPVVSGGHAWTITDGGII